MKAIPHLVQRLRRTYTQLLIHVVLANTRLASVMLIDLGYEHLKTLKHQHLLLHRVALIGRCLVTFDLQAVVTWMRT